VLHTLRAAGIGVLALLASCDRSPGSRPPAGSEPNKPTAAAATVRNPSELELWIANGHVESYVHEHSQETGRRLAISRKYEFEGRPCHVEVYTLDGETQWEWAVTNADPNSDFLQPENGRQTAHCVVVAHVPVVLRVRAGAVMRWDEAEAVTRRAVEPGRYEFAMEPVETATQPQ
jgi:hypothetical protein